MQTDYINPINANYINDKRAHKRTCSNVLVKGIHYGAWIMQGC
jgi:hypothetical protein